MTLADHTPTADILTMTYGEPDAFAVDSLPNATKVGWALEALTAYIPHVTNDGNRNHSPGAAWHRPSTDHSWAETDYETLVSDLMSDLLHLITFVGCDPEVALQRARRDFEAEAGLGYEP